MPRFSDEDVKKLSRCHVDLQTLFYEVVKHMSCSVVRIPERENGTLSHSVHVMPTKYVDNIEHITWHDPLEQVYFYGFVDGLATYMHFTNKISAPIKKTSADCYEVLL